MNLTLILRKILTAILTTLVFSSMMSLYFMNQNYDFQFYFIAVGSVSLIIIFFVGVPSSLIIEYIVNRLSALKAVYKWSIQVGLYLFFGLISSIVLLLQDISDDYSKDFVTQIMIFGISASFIFMLIDIVIKGIFKAFIK